MAKIRLTMSQAIVRYLMNQYVERDGASQAFFGGLWGIFGHGNIGGIAQAMQQYGPEFPYYHARNEQAMVHTALAYAKLSVRMRTYACLSSIGPGATNMVTGAAAATVNRLPVLILAGDYFAERVQAPVLQQVESSDSQDVSSNDTFRAVSRYWDRLQRPEQAITALPEVMRVLTSPADTGAVVLALPQDIQTYAFDYPEEMFHKRVWTIPRNRPDTTMVARAAEWIRESKSPLIIAGGGVRYSEAEGALRRFAEQTGIPVAETHAGKGAMPYDHPLSLGGAGVSGTEAANMIAPEADLVIGIGTRMTDFPTASKTGFQHPDVRFININVFEMDAHKHAAIPLIGDARVSVEELGAAVGDFEVARAYRDRAATLNRNWNEEVERVYNTAHTPVSQGEVIGAVEASSEPRDVVVTSAGSLPGDLLKLWRCRDASSYQVEYGYSVMGYEIAGGLGAKLAAPDREVYVMVGDGSFLMMSSEITTAVQEHAKLIIVVVDNKGFSSVGRVSESVGSEGFGGHYRYRGRNSGWYDGDILPVNFAKICEGLGARAVKADDLAAFKTALSAARAADTTTCIVVDTDWHERVPGYATCWWDMATAQVSEMEEVNKARAVYEKEKAAQRYLMIPGAPK
jgi:3D-(3,5/4)-trihydroxycyclohexane-1,2-dione acylhydrolase (decyclizing)